MLRFKLSVLLIPLFFAFGQEEDQIQFQHVLHVDDEELACSDCHSGIENADGFSWDVFPKKEVCLECHDGDSADDACEYCHSNPDEPLPFSKSWIVSGLDFSHASHLANSDDCNKCHAYINEDEDIELPNIWKESNCFACHKDIEEPPKSHDFAWEQFHGTEINSSTENNCTICHTNNSCEECHQLQQFTPETHPADYLFFHGFEAKAGMMECTTCHEIIEDCYSCHVENQIMPMNHNFYNWVSLTDGGLHGEFAEGEAELCATCHLPAIDSSCLKCHIGD